MIYFEPYDDFLWIEDNNDTLHSVNPIDSTSILPGPSLILPGPSLILPGPTFLSELLSCYPTIPDLVRQVNIDLPRQYCTINQIRIHSFLQLFNQMEAFHTQHFLHQVALFCTQATLFPVLQELFAIYHTENTHVVDFSDSNPLRCECTVFDSTLHVCIQKKFKHIYLPEHQANSPSDSLLLNTLDITLQIHIEQDTMCVFWHSRDSLQ